jgi:hypothetical protein
MQSDFEENKWSDGPFNLFIQEQSKYYVRSTTESKTLWGFAVSILSFKRNGDFILVFLTL